ncbi:very short patch repair endonuclease [Rhodomicrobium sp. R_RK_3]|uniref:very short patch repair endonuclease n=1 Tax=Rhodomicrobium sp. R_RK_3 TaxID=2029567 RepID=UPI001AECB239|nr:very short patch repair endonuclease [Rhodomicrobium sp. R_RK_3]
MDNLDPEQRRKTMRAVRSRDTTPEIIVRRMAHRLGLRFRLHRRDLPGNPDLVFPRYHLAVFVHGCFWHRHPDCDHATMPRTRVDYWTNKFNQTIARDAAAIEGLKSIGWRALVLWECRLREPEYIKNALRAKTTVD